jgi:hypothetical protein
MDNAHSSTSAKEEEVISKVAELMETLDQVKRYNALARSLRTSSLIIAVSIAAALAIVLMFNFLENMVDSLIPLALLIPLSVVWGGITLGAIYMEKSIGSVRVGEWKEELSRGFPSALKLLLELDWDRTLEELSLGRLSYALYGFMKAVAYWIATTTTLEILWRAYTLIFPQNTTIWDILIWAVVALAIVLLALSRDLSRRYKELNELDALLSELRWFSCELRRAEFQT